MSEISIIKFYDYHFNHKLNFMKYFQHFCLNFKIHRQ